MFHRILMLLFLSVHLLASSQQIDTEKEKFAEAQVYLSKYMPDLALPILFNILDSVSPNGDIVIIILITQGKLTLF